MPNPKRDMLMLLIIFVTFQYFLVSSDDPFESLLIRLFCYGDEQEGCSMDLTEAYPNYAWSYNNLTKATTHFYLFTKDNVDKPELLHKCAADVPLKTNFNPHCRTEIFIPGYAVGVCNTAIYRELKNERLKCGCYNVILVDWMWGNVFVWKEAKLAKLNLKIVAQHIVILIRNLKKRYGLGADDFILTGHGLGAHGAGYVGQDEPIGIINGLDPTGGRFTENTPLNERLDAGDAKCVHVMHCNAGQCTPYSFGANFTCGTIDAWFNDGAHQAACFPQLLESFLKLDYMHALLSFFHPACSHFQCLQYYKVSMCPTDDYQFLGVNCSNYIDFVRGKYGHYRHSGRQCAIIGAYACDSLSERSVRQKNQNYYLKTRTQYPFFGDSSLCEGGA